MARAKEQRWVAQVQGGKTLCGQGWKSHRALGKVRDFGRGM
jgi:hypothetical protein